ncbi:hypothetical protein CHARACLAT_023367 [Characodon lateralis]|uniref:Uncharacterized protein n=1 Tax=Characodon lateralis TaxID=208331 RepID=A0ABU7ECX3_9TELE|nr:hypothetical protein [Characodon lateralis]
MKHLRTVASWRPSHGGERREDNYMKTAADLGVRMQTTAGKFFPLYKLECRPSAPLMLMLLFLLLGESVNRGFLERRFLKGKV